MNLKRAAAILLVCVATRAHASSGQAEQRARVEQWISSLEKDPSFKVRVQAAVLLGRVDSAQALAPLTRALSDEHVAVRGAVCLALSRLQNPQVVAPLLRVAATDEDEAVREEARRALQALPHEVVVSKVVAVAASSDVELRREAILALSAWTEEEAQARLIEALADAPPIRQIASEAIAARSEAQRLQLLKIGLASPKPAVRLAAAGYLAEVGTAAAVRALMDAYEQEVDDAESRRVLREHLRNLRALMPKEQLLADAKSADDRFKRARALRFLGVMGGESCFDVLIANLSADDVYLRGVAALALAEAGDARAIQPLMKLIDDEGNSRIAQIVRNSVQILQRKDSPLRD